MTASPPPTQDSGRDALREEVARASYNSMPLNGVSFENAPVDTRAECYAEAEKILASQSNSEIGVLLSAVRALIAEREAERDEARAERRRLSHVIERDRSKVADSINTIKTALGSREWLAGPGRGSYAFDDERYQREFGDALEAIHAALKPLIVLARDWSDCPVKWDEILECRRDAAIASAEVLKAENERLEANLDRAMKRGIRAWSNRLHIPVTRMMSRVLREEVHAARAALQSEEAHDAQS